jgi:parallel beta-helix repeat protein
VLLAALACSGCAIGQTGDPVWVGHNGASLGGQVVSDSGGQVEYWVQYGRTKSYGSESPHQTVTVTQNIPAAVTASVDGLARSTLFHYRLCAQDNLQRGGPGCGEDRTVKTQSFACGETVRTNVRFTGDVACIDVPINAPGLVVGAPGILIDLHGFQMVGPVGVGSGYDPAIDNRGGFDDVTIRDGEVRNFGDGIALTDASRNQILNVTSRGPSDGIEIHGGEANEIRHSGMFGRGAGLVATATTGLIVADSTAQAAFSHGMELSGLIGSRVVRNTVPGGQGCCTSIGISIAGNDNVIQANRVSAWGGGNFVLASGANNKLLDNQALDGPGDGIFVGAFTAGTIVRRNTATGNDDDGIDVRGVQSRIGDNTANDNGDFGIDAVAGVTDLGGNTASGNGNPLQCRNVFCQ